MSKGPGPDYQVPSFEMFRPITNISENTVLGFEDAFYDFADASAEGNELQNVQIQFGNPDQMRIPLVSAEEVAGLHDYYGLHLGRTESKRLKDHIDKNVAYDLKGPADVLSLPASVSWQFAKNSPMSRGLVAIGAGKQLLRDRRELRRTMLGFYDKPETDEEMARVWPDTTVFPDAAFMTITGHQRKVAAALKIVNVVLARTNVIPEVLETERVRQKGVGVYRKRPQG